MVGDSRVVEYLTTLADAFVDMDLRFFESDEEERAWTWARDRGSSQEASA